MEKSNAQRQLEKVCEKFGVKDVYELDQVYLRHDQDLIKNGRFDLQDKTLMNNQIKDALLIVNLAELSEDERHAVQGILWLWYHHATTIAIWQQHDLALAKKYCDKAMMYLYPGHPNKITTMLRMLLSGDIERARKWMDEKIGEAEHEYAAHLLAEYERGVFKERPPARNGAGGSPTSS